ncbi:MAG TPA: hypothetical protein VES59_08310 [Bacteroidota bacterium]|nr:hypothetical protein [Bacteroidota bacterium]
MTKLMGQTLSTKETLESLRSQILQKWLPIEVIEEFEAIQGAIDRLRAANNSHSKKQPEKIASVPAVPSTHSKVVEIALELIDKREGHSVRNAEIIEYAEQKGIDIGKGEDRDSTVGRILHDEWEKKHGKLRKVNRGLWNKREKPLANRSVFIKEPA